VEVQLGHRQQLARYFGYGLLDVGLLDVGLFRIVVFLGGYGSIAEC